jgi:hypothetical protein
LVILLLALLALSVGRRSEPGAPSASSIEEAATAPVQIAPVERHETDDGLSSQRSLSRPGVMTGKARPTMTSHALSLRSSWQGERAVALNPFFAKGSLAIDAQTPSGAAVARAQTRAP